jgi:hypothetical protein
MKTYWERRNSSTILDPGTRACCKLKYEYGYLRSQNMHLNMLIQTYLSTAITILSLCHVWECKNLILVRVINIWIFLRTGHFHSYNAGGSFHTSELKPPKYQFRYRIIFCVGVHIEIRHKRSLRRTVERTSVTSVPIWNWSAAYWTPACKS